MKTEQNIVRSLFLSNTAHESSHKSLVVKNKETNFATA